MKISICLLLAFVTVLNIHTSNNVFKQKNHNNNQQGNQDRELGVEFLGNDFRGHDNLLNPEHIVKLMMKTADWQLANPYDLSRILEWQWGTFFVGLREFYEITEEDRYMQELMRVGEENNWQTLEKYFYADNILVTSTWAWLYDIHKKKKMIKQPKQVMDDHIVNRPKHMADVTFAGNKEFDKWWTWCDALFMAPPAFARMAKVTKEQKYLDYMDEMWWITTQYLYSAEDSLFYRDDRYFEKKSSNNKKIFWSRGNGWVLAGIAQVLKVMPEDYPTRNKYENLYQEMAIKILSLQDNDGLWRVSLLDTEFLDKGEVSGSAFYVYALAWGLNNGLIKPKFRPQIEKGWKALCLNVNEHGKLGNVQPEGIDPKPFSSEDWHVYGTGAFLLAGTEIYKLIIKNHEKR